MNIGTVIDMVAECSMKSLESKRSEINQLQIENRNNEGVISGREINFEGGSPDVEVIRSCSIQQIVEENKRKFLDVQDILEKEIDIEKNDSVLEGIENSIETSEGIKNLLEIHSEKSELWKSQMEALETLNNLEASPVEIRSAQAKLSILKGQLMETAVKDALVEAGFDVETQQRVVAGESGGTRPDVIAKNNTDHPIEVFGVIIKPEETMSAECKCGGTAYMTNQLNNHIPNQLSGQEGTKILLTTSDIKDTPAGLASSVCEKYGANLVVLDVSVANVENAIKEVAVS